MLVVADGMGGEAGGELAAQMAVVEFKSTSARACITPSMLPEIAGRVQKNILRHSVEHPDLEGMGTTLTAALVSGTLVHWLHVGDSRLYRFKTPDLVRLTEDHRFLATLLEHGDITPEEARTHPFRNMLDQCLGCPKITPDVGYAEIEPGDTLLLCTDGLYGELPGQAIAAVLAESSAPEVKAEKLLAAALSAGAKDDMTLIVVNI